MKSIRVSEVIPVDAQRAWTMVREFDSIARYEDIIESCELIEKDGGLERIITFAGGSLHQRLESSDDETRTLAIRTLATDLPLESFEASIAVREVGAGECEITWQAELEPASDQDIVAALLRDLYLVLLGRFAAELTGV